MINKEELLQECNLQFEDVALPSGKVCRVSEISATDYMNLWNNCTGEPDSDGKREVDMTKLNCYLLAYSIVDESGNRIFKDEEAPLFERFAATPFKLLITAAKRLNGLMGDEGNA